MIGVGTTALLLYSSVLRGRRVTASWETRFPMDPSSPGPGAYWAGVSGGDHRAKDGAREPRS